MKLGRVSSATCHCQSAVGPGRVAVEHHDRRPHEERRDERVPHHPGGRAEPEQAAARLQVPAERVRLEVLEQDAAVPVDDRLRPAGRPRREEHEERMVERDGLEGERTRLGEELLPGDRVRRPCARRRGRARRGGAWGGRRGSSPPPRDGRSTGRGSRSRRRSASTAGSSCTRRSTTLRTPSSGAQLAQTAPRLAVAANATSVSGMFGRYATTRSPGPTPRRARPARARATCSRKPANVSSAGARVCDRETIATRSRVLGLAHQVLGEVEPRAGEPGRARHRVGCARTVLYGACAFTSKNSQIEDQKPARSSTDHRCRSS